MLALPASEPLAGTAPLAAAYFRLCVADRVAVDVIALRDRVAVVARNARLCVLLDVRARERVADSDAVAVPE